MKPGGAPQWFFWLAVSFGAWNVFLSLAAFGSGILWSVLISKSMPPVGMLLHGVVSGGTAALAIAAARGRARRRTALWASALAISAGEWTVGVLRIGLSPDDWVDLAILVAVALASLCLLRSSRPDRESPV